MKRIQVLKYAKLLLGCLLAVAIANQLSLKFAYSAGIITLLTIQDTKIETLRIAAKRLIIFAAMTGISFVIFRVAGYHLLSFGLVLVPYLFLCMALNMKEAIAPIAVLCTHYISEQSCSPAMIANEFLILLIGAGIGILLNLFFQDRRIIIRKKQEVIENKMRDIFANMAMLIEKKDAAMESEAFFKEIDSMLNDLKTEAVTYINNHFLPGNDYFYNYVIMRTEQCRLLKQIYEDILRLDMVYDQAKKIAEYFKEISAVFHETNNVKQLLQHLNALYDYFREDELPATRTEFENRALLYHILEDTKKLILLKQQFYIEHSKDIEEIYRQTK